MAQAEILCIKSGTRPPEKMQSLHSNTSSSTGPLWSDAFFDMEGDIADLVEMASIANMRVHDAIGETSFDGDVVADHNLTSANVASTMFAVRHVLEMARKFQETYYRAFDAAR